MISSLKGKLIAAKDGALMVEVGGIGFKVFVSSSTFAQAPKIGEPMSLLTELRFKDREGFELYGFIEARERRMFMCLIEVPGVGPRGALGILSAANIDELEQAIAAGDDKLLTRVSGIGRKKAQKILIELKEKYADIELALGGAAGETTDLLDALVSMGYPEAEARTAVRDVPNDISGMENRLREALRILGR